MESVTSMDYNDHLEDRPPSISPPLSPIQRTPLSDNEEQHNAKRYMDKFRNEQTAKYLESKFEKRLLKDFTSPSNETKKNLSWSDNESASIC